MKAKLVLLLVVFQLLSYVDTYACTTFVIKDSTNIVYGRNFDWDIGYGFITINKRGLEKRAFVQPPNKPAIWISRYGSVTFNQIGVDAPMGGMNEKGLVIAQMGLFESVFPPTDGKHVVGGLEWIQYQLDNSSTLAEVIENNKKIRISSDIVPVHYMICDSLGNIGIIEYIDGKLVIQQGGDISIPVCSNMIYEQSKKELTEFNGFGGQKAIPAKWANISEIIAITNSKINDYKKTSNNNLIDYSFDILKTVGSSIRTQWSVVFDIKTKTIHFKTLDNKNIRVLDFKSFEYSCNNYIQILNIHESNNETELHEQFVNLTFDYYFDYKKNLIGLYKENMKGFPDIPDEFIKLEVEYAINRKCE